MKKKTQSRRVSAFTGKTSAGSEIWTKEKLKAADYYNDDEKKEPER